MAREGFANSRYSVFPSNKPTTNAFNLLPNSAHYPKAAIWAGLGERVVSL
jgi:hypothetical protein